MITYASADLTGVTFTTDKNITHTSTWRNLHAETRKVSKCENVSPNSTDAAFQIAVNAEPRHYNRAMFQLVMSGKKVTMLKLALIIQSMERAETRVTGKSKGLSDVDNVYDGRIVSMSDRMDEGYIEDVDIRHYNYTQLRGKKGRMDNIKRLPSIPPRRAAALDKDMAKLRESMLALREWWLKTPSK